MQLKIVSYSELDTARQCPLKHQLSYIERWSREVDPMSPLSKGSAWHLVMETHYRSLLASQQTREPATPKTRLAEAERAVAKVLSRMQYGELAELIAWMYDGYVKHFGIDEHWKILAVEHEAQCRLPTPRGTASSFVLKMKIDLVVQDRTSPTRSDPAFPQGGRRPRIRVVDHKSCANLPKDLEFDLNDQFGLYTWGMRKLGKPVFGQIYNAARTARNKVSAQPLDTRFLRHSMYRTDTELDRIAIDAYETARSRYAEQRRISQMPELDAPRFTNQDTCRWRCDFTEACLLGRKTDGAHMRDMLKAQGFIPDHSRH